MKKILLLSFVFLTITVRAQQDFNCKVDVIYNQISSPNKQLFNNLKTSISEFINNTKWIEEKLKQEEKIDWVITIQIRKWVASSPEDFEATAMIQSSRPVYGTTLNTVLLNMEDVNFSFKYASFQQMQYRDGIYSDELTSLLGFYCNLVIGMDFHSFSLDGGNKYINKANEIVNSAQSSSQYGGWNTVNSDKNRYWLIENLLNPRFKPMLKVFYEYHIKGLDVMYKNMDEGRLIITENIKTVSEVWSVSPNSYLLRIWFNSKSAEIINIYCKALQNDKVKVIELLKKSDPANATKYEKIMSCN